MNDFPYPNRMFNVFTGQQSYTPLPFRCSPANFTSTDIYTWMQQSPFNSGANTITSMNLGNMQTQTEDFVLNTTICVNGTSTANQCEGDYNSYLVYKYQKDSDFVPADNCGSEIFSHGHGTTT